MKTQNSLLFLVTFTLFSLSPNLASAQELPNNIREQEIIVQNDNEEPIRFHKIICRQIPKKLDAVLESEIIYHELETDVDGAAMLEVTGAKNFIFTCESKELTTQDYCWYFPSKTTFFEPKIQGVISEAIYLVGQHSPDSCGKKIDNPESYLSHLLPEGTPKPFKNKNIPVAYAVENVENPEPIMESETQNIGLLKWIFEKIKLFFTD